VCWGGQHDISGRGGGVGAFRESVGVAEANLENTFIRAPFNGLVTSTTNWSSFSEIAFAFRVTPRVLLNGMIFAGVMGLIGGFFPARKAAKQPVVVALREG
jgi:ABC-type antimicrobial peptide transport system permease subunit